VEAVNKAEDGRREGQWRMVRKVVNSKNGW
jgi:hypothetical protein